MLLSVGPLLVGVSVSATTYLLTLTVGLERLPDEAQPLLLRAGPVAVTAVTFFLVYRIVPHRHVPWSHALLGGLVAAVLFEAMKDLFAAYIRAVPTYNLVYGAFAAIPIFLLWVYLSWLVILLGAEVTACAQYWHDGRWKHAATPGELEELLSQLVRRGIVRREADGSYVLAKPQEGKGADSGR
jgi:membrane protein